MTPYILKALALGLAGAGAGDLLVWFAVTTWDSISTRWMHVAGLLPMAPLLVVYFGAADRVPSRRAFRTASIVLSAVLGGLTNYTAWIITSRTWFADQILPEHQGFLFQWLHPSVMPAFVEGTGASTLETGWIYYLGLGLFAGGGVFWWMTRPGRPDKAAAAS